MSDHAGAEKADLGVDLPAHEATYFAFIRLTENMTIHVLNIVLLLVLWTIKGHGFLALIGFAANIAASAMAGPTGLGWKLPAALFVLLGLACVVL